MTTVSDACEHGMGGYDESGNAWSFDLPPDLQGIFSINLLKFIAAVLTIRIVLRKHHRLDLMYKY